MGSSPTLGTVFPKNAREWESLLDMAIDKSKIWAKAKIIKPLQVKYCSDTSRYHLMTIARGMVVEVGEMPAVMGSEKQWCVFYMRPKGYSVLDFISTEKAKQHLETLTVDGEIQFDSAGTQRIISNRVLDVLTHGVEVDKKELKSIKIDLKVLQAIKKELL